jgi:hypothetical protein
MSALTRAGYGAGFEFTLLTNDRDLAQAGDEAGIDRIGVDIERLGKRHRQGHLPHLRISDHELDHLGILRPGIRRARLFVRCNPLHDRSGDEIDVALAHGADVLMLPFFRSAAEVERFVRLVRGRALVSLLLETPEAADAVDQIARVSGIGEIMVGLNDMQHGLRLSNPFEFVVSDRMVRVADAVREAGIAFGFGGLADPLNLDLPVPAPLVYAQYPRLGATSAFVARRFCVGELTPHTLRVGIPRCRAELDAWRSRPAADLESARRSLEQAAHRWNDSLRELKRAPDHAGEEMRQ